MRPLLGIHLSVAFSLLLVIAAPAISGQPSPEPTFSKEGDGSIFSLSGIISAETVREARTALAHFNRGDSTPHVKLHSSGGDVMAAIELGRLLREKRASAISHSCASACVLVLAGASKRWTLGDVVIHRPYFVSAASRPSQQGTQAHFNELRDAVRNYLQEVNVSPALWDAMVAISPSNAKVLTAQEINDFGLFEIDPVEEELQRQDEANRLHISPQEVLQREQLAKQVCILESQRYGDLAVHSNCLFYFSYGGPDVRRSNADYSAKFSQAWTFCISDERDKKLEALDVAMTHADEARDATEWQKLFALVQTIDQQTALCRQRQIRDLPWRLLFDIQ